MAPLLQENITEIMDNILQHMDPSLIHDYKKFIHDFIIQGISNHHLTMETISRCLLDLHKDVTATVVEHALSYYEMHAPSNYKYPLSYGN